jgi:Glycosyl transferase family 11
MSSPKTLVFTHGGGRFANQLYNYAHLLALTYEYPGEFEFIHMAFWQYGELLAISDTDPLCTNGQSGAAERHPHLLRLARWLDRWQVGNDTTIKRLIIWCLYIYYGNPLAHLYNSQAISSCNGDWLLGRQLPKLDLATMDTIMELRAANNTCFSGFNLCHWSLVVKHWEAIRDRLQIHPRYQQIGHSFITKLRQQHPLLIGVMIRQGDYRTWAAGRYFFEASQYLAWMNQALQLFPEYSAQDIGFVIASDEPQQIESFMGCQAYFTTGMSGQSGQYIESFVELSMCDYIFSPPSTFSMWSALLGNVPILTLFSVKQQLIRADFKPSRDFDLLEFSHR